MVIVWALLAIALIFVEMHHLAFFAMFGAVGAAAAAAFALAFPHAIAGQIGVGVASTAVGLVGMRPLVSRAFALRRHGTVVHGVHGGIVGSTAVAIDEVTAAAGGPTVGHVRLVGETWLAVAADGSTIAPGRPVTIVSVSGTTLSVVAIDSVSPSLPWEGTQ
jgi:membrane protein implicated in regulation of membrane protease activity